VLFACLAWKLKQQYYLDAIKAGYKTCLVDDNRLVSAGEQEMGRMLGFLGLEWDPAVLAHNHYMNFLLDKLITAAMLTGIVLINGAMN